MDGCVSGWRSDISQISSSIRVFPMPVSFLICEVLYGYALFKATERDFMSDSLVGSIKSAGLQVFDIWRVPPN